MPEINVVGQNIVTTWGWEISLYLFLGGLVAGLMIFSGVMRLARPGHFARSRLLADLAAFPLLCVGMLFLFLDLSNKINVWRLYTTFQVQSPMSWGAWILLATMLVLALRFVSRLPAPRPMALLGLHLFQAPVANEEDEAAESKARKPSPIVVFVEWGWTLLGGLAGWTNRHERTFALIGALLGTCVGFYTGILLSTMPARPLWNTAILAPLFLISGLASAGAFLCLFVPEREHVRLLPFSLLSCGIEFLFLLAFVINLNFGNNAAQRAGSILFTGSLGWAFWGLVLLAGLVVPAALEQLELVHRRFSWIPTQLPPVLKLVGSLTLRLVIVYAGVLSFM